MISPARRLCYKLLREIETRRLFSDAALNSEDMQSLEVRDRHLTTEIVYGTLRWQALLDYVLAEMSSRAWKDVALEAKILLRMSLYQMWQMDRVPEYAVVNDAVAIAKREVGWGIGAYLNGILRRLGRTQAWKNDDFLRKAPLWVQASLPKWLWDRWAGRYGEAAALGFAISLNSPPQAAVRLKRKSGIPQMPPFKVVESDLVPEAYIKISDTVEPPGEEIDGRSIQFQDEASQLIPHLLGVLPGERVWDACAAPGGKTAVLCNLCGPSGQVVASDLRPERAVRLAQLAKDWENPIPAVLIADAGRPAPFRGSFDAVLADVPCSGLGTLRRNPEKKWHFRQEDLSALQITQQKMLHFLSETVRVGGRLLYSTCSTEPEENEQVVYSFLDTHPGFSLEKPAHPPGIPMWTNQDSMVRTFPCDRGWDGFFAALVKRRS